jgi:hypothetical protein
MTASLAKANRPISERLENRQVVRVSGAASALLHSRGAGFCGGDIRALTSGLQQTAEIIRKQLSRASLIPRPCFRNAETEEPVGH